VKGGQLTGRRVFPVDPDLRRARRPSSPRPVQPASNVSFEGAPAPAPAGSPAARSVRGRHQEQQTLSSKVLDIRSTAVAERMPDGGCVAPPKAELAERGLQFGGCVEVERRRLSCGSVVARWCRRLLFRFRADLPLDQRVTEDLPGVCQIVSGAQQAQIIERVRSTERERRSVLDGQKASLTAALSFGIDVGALRAISLPHGARSALESAFSRARRDRNRRRDKSPRTAPLRRLKAAFSNERPSWRVVGRKCCLNRPV
jgi:hypothetical protein